MADLSHLPPPPKGQTGITLDQFNHLPPPPQGQKGFTLAELQQTLSPAPKSVMENYMGDINAAIDKFKGTVLQGANEVQNNPEGIKGVIPALASIGKIGLGSAAAGVQALFAPLAAPIQTLIQSNAAGYAQSQAEMDAKNPQGKAAREAIISWVQGLAQAHPELAQIFGDAFTVGTAVLGSGGLNATVGGTIGGIKNAVVGTKNAVLGTTGGLKTAVTGKIVGAFKGKTPEEILATPPDQLQKLSPHDRGVYFDAQREQATQAHTMTQEQINRGHIQIENQIKAESDAKINTLNNETQGLVNQADRASIEEAQNLKPKVIKAFQDNSKTYRDLIDKEIAPVRDEQIAHTGVLQFITEKNLDNPAKATELIGRLGLKDGQTSTIGEIYDQIKGLRQDIGKAGTKGTRVFTPDEMKINDAISTLSQYLKAEKGIDFGAANKFWSNYAPLRDKLIKAVQPFTPKGAESGTFSTFTKDIQNYVSGVKEGKVDFIQATEKLLGQKIGNPKTVLALKNLTANQKAKFAAKLEQENKLSDAKLLREQNIKDAKGTLSIKEKAIADKEFEVARKAQTRKNIYKTLQWTLGLGVAAEETKRLFGL